MKKRILAFALAAVMTLSLFSGCGKTEEPVVEVKPQTVEIVMPHPEGVRAVVQGEAATTVQAYLVARAYIAKLAELDLDAFDAQAFAELVQKASDTLNIAEQLSASLSEHCDPLIALEEKGEPTIGPAVLHEISRSRPGMRPLIPRAYAAEKSEAVQWAERVTNTFDKAPMGKKLQAIADDMGTDVKRAKLMLENAQNILSGEAYTDLAEFENNCYQAAVGVKAGATAAGFAVACVAAAPAAAAAGAAAATGGAAVSSAITFGGVVCSGVNTVLDVNTAAIIIATDGEGNEDSEALEKTASQFAPISAGFALAGAAVNIRNLSDALRGKGVLYDGTEIANAADKSKAILENSVNLGLFVVPEAVSEIHDGSALGGTFTRDESGWHFTLTETLLGQSSEEQQDRPETEPAQSQQTDVPFPADQVIQQYDGFNDPEEPFPVEDYVAFLNEMMAEATGEALPEAPEEEAEETEPEAEEPAEATGAADYDVSGTYTMVLNSEYGAADTVTAEVVLQRDNSMTMDFGLHKTVVEDDYSISLDMSQIGQRVHLTGTYNPETMTFRGMGVGAGGDAMSDSFFDLYDTVITFDGAGSAKGANAEGEAIFGMDICTYITMTRVGESAFPTAAEIAGTYVFAGSNPETGESGKITCIYAQSGETQVDMHFEDGDALHAGSYNPANGLWSWASYGQSAFTWFTKDANGKIQGSFSIHEGESTLFEGSGEKVE